MLASPQFGIHIPFWVMLFLASGIAAVFGILLGAPTLRLRGDYLAIVTLGFGEIVPQTFLNLSNVTNGPNGIASLDQPSLFGYRFGFNALAVLLLDPGADRARRLAGLQPAGQPARARLDGDPGGRARGRATWGSTRPPPSSRRSRSVRRSAGSRACVVRLEARPRFARSVRIQRQRAVLSMLVLGGMGNIPGVIVGSFAISFINSFLLPQSTNLAHGFGVDVDFTNSRFMIYGVILVADDALSPRRADTEPPAPRRTARRVERSRHVRAGASRIRARPRADGVLQDDRRHARPSAVWSRSNDRSTSRSTPARSSR